MCAWTSIPRVEWDTLLARSRHDFYQLSSYVELDAATDESRPIFLHRTIGDYAALLPLLVRRIPKDITGDRELFDSRSPYGYPGMVYPEGMDAAGVRELLTSIGAAGASLGLVSTFLRLHPIYNDEVDNLAGDQGICLVASGRTVSIDLTLGREALDRRLRNNHRRDIAKLGKAGFRVRFDSWDDYPQFQEIYHETMARHNASARYYFSVSYFDGLRNCLGSRFRLCSVLAPDGNIAAAGVFVHTGNLVQYHLGGTNQQYARLAPSKLMFHVCRNRFQEEGASRLHLGGGLGGAADSLFNFKLGFGTDTHDFRTARVIHDSEVYAGLSTRQRKRASIVNDNGTFFPAYRTA